MYCILLNASNGNGRHYVLGFGENWCLSEECKQQFSDASKLVATFALTLS